MPSRGKEKSMEQTHPSWSTNDFAMATSPVMRYLGERGYIKDATDIAAIDGQATTGKLVCYVGYDCTADSLHVGSLISIMMLRQLQRFGHKPVVLMGGGTTKVGDPSGKDESRQMLTIEKINRNMEGLKKVFGQFLTFGDGPSDAIMVNNADWLDKLNYIDFLRDYGPHFTINRMLTFESVKLRLEREQPLTFLEFNYMLLQAYDFLELSRRHGVNMQMGGSDQWGNILNGVELTRRVDGKQIYGLTTNLLTTASGKKMGKSESGAVWLNADKLSDFDYWQFWRNTEDADVGKFLRLFTELPANDIAKLENLPGAQINEAKKILADQATILCRGKTAAESARQTAEAQFSGAGGTMDLPEVTIDQAKLTAGLSVIELLQIAGFTTSNGESRRLIKGGGARLNDLAISDETQTVSRVDIDENLGGMKVSSGKKKHVLIKVDAL